MVPAEGSQLAHESHWEREPLDCAAMAVNRRARPVRGPLQRGGGHEMLAPISGVLTPLFRGSLCSLPVCEVSILDGRLRQWRGLARRKGLIKRRQFGKKCAVCCDRVKNDLVDRHIQTMFVLSDSHREDSQQRACFQIERAAGAIRGQPCRLTLALLLGKMAQVNEWSRKCLRRQLNDLHRLAGNEVKGGAPNFVAADDFDETPFEHPHVERSMTVHRDGFIVERNVARHLAMKPDLLL